MKTVDELYFDYKKVCEEYEVEINENIRDIINEKIEYIKTKEKDLFSLAKTSMKYTDKKYPKYNGIIKVNTILKRFNILHIHLLVVWDELQKMDFVIYPIE